MDTFCLQLRTVNMSLLGCLCDGLKEYVKMLLSSTPTVRPDADQISKVIQQFIRQSRQILTWNCWWELVGLGGGV